MTDVIALGELLIDFACRSTDAAGYPTMAAHPGGGPPNFLAALSKFGAKTALIAKVGTDAFGNLLKKTLNQLGIDNINDMIKFVYADTTGKKEIAALAPNIMLGLAAGEKVAFDAMEKAAEKLAEMVGPVVEKLQMQNGELAFCGSVITKNEVVIEKLKSKLKAKYPELKCIQPKMDAAFGSALRALEEV